MIRTQVSLDKNEYESAKTQAAALGISLAEFIRRAVRENFTRRGPRLLDEVCRLCGKR